MAKSQLSLPNQKQLSKTAVDESSLKESNQPPVSSLSLLKVDDKRRQDPENWSKVFEE